MLRQKVLHKKYYGARTIGVLNTRPVATQTVAVAPEPHSHLCIVEYFLSQHWIFLWILDLWPESVFVNNRIKSRVIFQLIRFMTKWIYKHSDYILLQSKAMFEPVIKNGGDVSKFIPKEINL